MRASSLKEPTWLFLAALLLALALAMAQLIAAQPSAPSMPGPDMPMPPSSPPSSPGSPSMPTPPGSPTPMTPGTTTTVPSSGSADASAQPTGANNADPDLADYKDYWGNSYEQSWKNAQSPGAEILQTTFDLTLRQHCTSIPFRQHPKGNWYRHNKGKYQLPSEANGFGAADSSMSIAGSADDASGASFVDSYTSAGVNVSVADQVKFYTFGVADSAGLPGAPGTKLPNEPVTAYPSIRQLVVAEGIGQDLIPKFSPDRHKPADASAAAGKDQIVQVVNGFISVFRKQNGDHLHGPIDMRKFFVKVKACRSPWASSPWVTFDQLAGRFILLMTTKPRPLRRHAHMYAQPTGYTYSAADDAAYPYEDTEDYSEHRYGMDTWDGVDEDLDADDVEDWQSDLQATNDPVYNEKWQTKRPKKRAPVVCLAVSQTFDALGKWDQYAFSSMSGDHKGHAWENGKLSKWPSGYFMTFDVMQSYMNKVSVYGGVSAAATSSSSWWNDVDVPITVNDSVSTAASSTSADASTAAATDAAAAIPGFPFPTQPKCAPRPNLKKPKPELGSVFCAVDRRALLLECTKDKPCIPFKCTFIAQVRGCLAADLDGYLLPPPHTPELFVCPTTSRTDNTFFLYKWRVDWKLGDSLLSGPCKVKVPDHQKGCYGKEKCIQHPSRGDAHGAYGETLGPRLSFRVFQSIKKTGPGTPMSPPSDPLHSGPEKYKPFITGTLVLVHTVVAEGKHTINWYEFLVAGPFFKPFQFNSKGFEVFDDGGKGMQSGDLFSGPGSPSGLASGPGLADPLAGMGTSSSSPGWESYGYGHGDCRYYGDFAYDGETPIRDDSLGSGGPGGMPGAGVSSAGFNAYGYSASFDPGYQYNYESDAKDYQAYQHGSCVFGKGGYGYGYDQYGCYDSKRYPWWDNQKFYLILHQHGRLGSNDNKHRFVASAALDHVGNLAIIYQATSRVSPNLPPATFVAYRTTGYRKNYCTETDVQLHCSPDTSFVSEERRAGIDKIDIDDSSFNVLTSGDSSPVQLSASPSVPTFFDDGYTRLYSEGTYKNGCPRYEFHYHQRRLWSSLTSLVLDPCDDCTFVATAQYLKERKKKCWRTGMLGYGSWQRSMGDALSADADEVASSVSDMSTTAVVPTAQKKWLEELWNDHNDWSTKLFELRFKNCIPAPLYGAYKNKKGPFKGAPGSDRYPGGYDEAYSGYLNPLPSAPSMNAAPCLFEQCPSLVK